MTIQVAVVGGESVTVPSGGSFALEPGMVLQISLLLPNGSPGSAIDPALITAVVDGSDVILTLPDGETLVLENGASLVAQAGLGEVVMTGEQVAAVPSPEELEPAAGPGAGGGGAGGAGGGSSQAVFTFLDDGFGNLFGLAPSGDFVPLDGPGPLGLLDPEDILGAGPVPQPVTFTLGMTMGLEDQPIQLAALVSQNDLEGLGETLTLVIRGIPEGVQILDVDGNLLFTGPLGGGSYSVPAVSLMSLYLLPTPDNDADFTLSIDGTTAEPTNPDAGTVTVTASVLVVVKAVADLATFKVDDLLPADHPDGVAKNPVQIELEGRGGSGANDVADKAQDLGTLPAPTADNPNPVITVDGWLDINNGDDVDLYRIEITQIGTYKLEIDHGDLTTPEGDGGRVDDVDSMISLFAADGAYLGTVDDENLGGGNLDPLGIGIFGPGTYIVAITQFPNFPIGPNLSDGFTGSGGLAEGGDYQLTIQLDGADNIPGDMVGITTLEDKATEGAGMWMDGADAAARTQSADVALAVSDSDGSESLTRVAISLDQTPPGFQLDIDGDGIFLTGGANTIDLQVTRILVDGDPAVADTISVTVTYDAASGGAVFEIDPALRVQSIDLSDFSWLVQQHDDLDFMLSFEVRSTETNPSEGSTLDESQVATPHAYQTGSLAVNNQAVADKPTLTIGASLVAEDNATLNGMGMYDDGTPIYTVPLTAAVTDMDGSESLTQVQLNSSDVNAAGGQPTYDGTPVFTLLGGVAGSLNLDVMTQGGAANVSVDVAFNGQGITLTFDPADRVQSIDMSKFGVQLPQHLDGRYDITLIATATETNPSEAGDVAVLNQTQSETFTLDIEAVADKATVVAADVSFNEDKAVQAMGMYADGTPVYAAPFSAAVTDQDGSESITRIVLDSPEANAVGGQPTFGGIPVADIWAGQGTFPAGTLQIEVTHLDAGGTAVTETVTATGFFNPQGITIDFDPALRVQSIASGEFGLQLPQHKDGIFTIEWQAVTTETDPLGVVKAGAGTANLSGTLDITVGAVADKATVTAADVTVKEDNATDSGGGVYVDGSSIYAVPFTASVTDSDLSESITQVVINATDVNTAGGQPTYGATPVAVLWATAGNPLAGTLDFQAVDETGATVTVTAQGFFNGQGIALSFDASDRIQSVDLAPLGIQLPPHRHGDFTLDWQVVTTETNAMEPGSIVAATATQSGSLELKVEAVAELATFASVSGPVTVEYGTGSLEINSQVLDRATFAADPTNVLGGDYALASPFFEKLIHGSLTGNDDVDRYSVEIKAGEGLGLDIDPNTLGALQLKVYGPNGALLAEDSDGAGDSPEIPGLSGLDAGTYFIEVSYSGNDATPADYDLAIGVGATAGTAADFAGTLVTAVEDETELAPAPAEGIALDASIATPDQDGSEGLTQLKIADLPFGSAITYIDGNGNQVRISDADDGSEDRMIAIDLTQYGMGDAGTSFVNGKLVGLDTSAAGIDLRLAPRTSFAGTFTAQLQATTTENDAGAAVGSQTTSASIEVTVTPPPLATADDIILTNSNENFTIPAAWLLANDVETGGRITGTTIIVGEADFDSFGQAFTFTAFDGFGTANDGDTRSFVYRVTDMVGEGSLNTVVDVTFDRSPGDGGPVEGTGADEILIADADEATTLDGGGGSDLIVGGGADDTILAAIADGRETDRVYGGDGTDQMIFTADAGASETYTLRPYFVDGLLVAQLLDAAGTVLMNISEVEEFVFNANGGGSTLTPTGDLSGTGIAISTITFNGDAGANTFDASGIDPAYPVRVVADGGAGGDRLIGGAGNDQLVGREDSDTLYGGDGNDRVEGDFLGGALVNGGDDSVYGGAGNDTLGGGLGDDSLFGGSGTDLLLADQGHDTLYGDDGDGATPGDDGNDRLYGGAGNDLVFGEGGDDRLHGDGSQGGGVNAPGSDGHDTLYGGDGNDLLLGDDFGTPDANADGNDTLYGGSGNDSLEGQGGDDSLYGGADDDSLSGGDGNDRLYGGLGSDIMTGEEALADGPLFSGGDDILYGDEGVNPETDTAGAADTLVGGGGEDTLYGEGGNDWLYGHYIVNPAQSDEGNTLYGGMGDDSLFGGSFQINVNLAEQRHNELYGGAGNDRLFGDGTSQIGGAPGGHFLNADSLYGGTGDDLLVGDRQDGYGGADKGGNDTLDGGDGNDTLYGDAVSFHLGAGLQGPVAGNDTLYGGDNDDTLYGDAGSETDSGLIAGSDTLYGGEGDDLLFGDLGSEYASGGDDTLYGGAGDDTLFGGSGIDSLYGGEGDDTIGWTVGDGSDTAIDGGADTDRLLLRADGMGTAFVISSAPGFVQATSNATDTVTANGIEGLTVVGGAGDDSLTVSLASLANAGLDSLSFEDANLNGVPAADSDSLTVTGSAGVDLITIGLNGAFAVLTAVQVNGAAAGESLQTSGVENWTLDLSQGGYDTVLASGSLTTAGIASSTITVTTGDDGSFINFSTLADNVGLVATGGDDYDVLAGGGGADLLYGGGGGDQLSGSANNDALYGGAGSDTLLGGDGADSLDGGIDSDSLVGGAGNDTLFGGDDADSLVGGSNDDTLFGGAGADILTGGLSSGLTGTTDSDTFVFSAGDGGATIALADVITDFADGIDQIGLSGGLVLSTALSDAQFVNAGTLGGNAADSALIINDGAGGASEVLAVITGGATMTLDDSDVVMLP